MSMPTWLQVVEMMLKYSKTIVSMFVFLISLGGYGIYDFAQTVEAEKNTAIHEVAQGFQHAMIYVEPIKETKVIVESNCNVCEKLWKEGIRKAKKELKEELELKYHR